MPSNAESLPTSTREEFCLAMKAARERNGVTLAAIAEATKIPASRFAALERSDLRCWPKGLFRRAYFREYAARIGVNVADACAEFSRWFPDAEGVVLAQAAAPSELERVARPQAVDTVAPPIQQPEPVRLVLDGAWHGPKSSLLLRLLSATIDAVTVMAIAVAITLAAGVDPRPTIAVVTLAYFSLATAVFGESPAKWAMSRLLPLREAFRDRAPAVGEKWNRIAAVISGVLRMPNRTPEPPVDESEMREWVTDARRVGSPRLRVRFKAHQ